MSHSRPTSLFSRLRRYSPTPGQDPYEDRLTEALAATFEAAPEAARHVVGKWWDLDVHGSPAITTQRRADGLDRVDLELRFAAPSELPLTVWIEAKAGAPAERSQAERYLESQGRLPGKKLFAWLLPVGTEIRGGTPPQAAVRTWEDLAVALDEWRGDTSTAESGGFATGVVAEFIRHLEEENMASTHPLEPGDVIALDRYDLALARLEAVVRGARARVGAAWGTPGYSRQQPRFPDFFEHWPTGSWSLPSEFYFEWHCRRDDARIHPRGERIIGAGATFAAASAPTESDSPEWLESLYGDGFEYARKGSYSFLCRYRTLAELQEGDSLQDQAAGLANWVVETFQALDKRRPPVPR